MSVICINICILKTYPIETMLPEIKINTTKLLLPPPPPKKKQKNKNKKKIANFHPEINPDIANTMSCLPHSNYVIT